ncbi:MAG: hypothetical protein GY857_02455 [Desulfobacula sp.]|nr:hypothetical protein [Desulfobacula sp.]
MVNPKNILLFSPPENSAAIRLQGAVANVVPWDNITIIQKTESLFHILRQPQNKVEATVILVSSCKELDDLLNFRDLLHRNCIILVLPDQNKTTITLGHVLRPRFLTFTDSDFSDVRDVLKKILGKVSAES